MTDRSLIFRVHALQRMFERGISEVEIRDVVEHGEIIERRPDDFPYPCVLILGRVAERHIHIVMAIDSESDTDIIVTVYEPDLQKWLPGFRRRR